MLYKKNKYKKIINSEQVQEDDGYNINNPNDDIEEDGDDEDNINAPKDSEIVIYIEDKSINEINNLMSKDKRIIMNLDYQRNFVWDEMKQTRLIDSIFIGMPIPPIWLVRKENKRTFEVIDGLQRLSTVKKFLDNKLKLSSNVVTDSKLEDKTFSQLDDNYKYDFLDSNLKIAIVKEESYTDKDLVYELFKRINQNTVPLTKQELRNATYISDFNNELKDMAESDSILKKLLKSNTKKRLKHLEMFYRYLSLIDTFNYREKKVSKSQGVDERVTYFMKKAIDFSEKERKKYLELLLKSIRNVYKVFGDNSFKKWENEKFKSAINVPIMELQLLILGYFNEETLLSKKDKIVESFKKFLDDEEVKYSLRAATNSQHNTNLRIEKFINFLSDNGVNYDENNK